MRRSFSLLCCLAFTVACSPQAETPLHGDDASIAVSDAAGRPCTPPEGLVIGHCVDRATGEPCRNFDAEYRDLVPLANSVAVPQIIGLQGLPMFVFGVSLEHGDSPLGQRQPLVALEVNLGTSFVGGYTARPDLLDDPNDASQKIAPQLYVITLLEEEVNGQQAEVSAQVRADSGEEWCAKAFFKVGALITNPIPP